MFVYNNKPMTPRPPFGSSVSVARLSRQSILAFDSLQLAVTVFTGDPLFWEIRQLLDPVPPRRSEAEKVGRKHLIVSF